MSYANNMIVAVEACESKQDYDEVLRSFISSGQLIGIYEIDRNFPVVLDMINESTGETEFSAETSMDLMPFTDLSAIIVARSEKGAHLFGKHVEEGDGDSDQASEDFYRVCSAISSEFEEMLNKVITRFVEKLDQHLEESPIELQQ